MPFAMPVPSSLQKSLDATKVEYMRLGSSGLRVSSPIFGGMSIGSTSWIPFMVPEPEALTLLKAAYDCGINTWDTAAMYSNGISEEIFGKAMQQFKIPREKVVILTKCYNHVGEEDGLMAPAFFEQMQRSKDYVNQGGGCNASLRFSCSRGLTKNAGLSRAAIFKSVEGSLKRLGTSYIDLFQIHRYDSDTPIEETMKALHDLVQAGKILYIGASSMWATQFAQMQSVAEKNGWTKFICMQNYYNLCYREEEREMNRFCNDTGVGIINWSPLFAGRLARRVGYDESQRSKFPTMHDNGLTATDTEIVNRVEELAGRKGWKMSQVALAWLKTKGTIPIVGFNSVARIEEACETRGKELTTEEVKYLEEPYVPKMVAGHF
jgi:aryl-alcohol dehydrogenase-like predicted oxidoreductase